ncbi:hypothetical protein Vafri_1719 [Volvox africanus]|nr:hypothetical protein Vafri_1719 [Volvox africanus]
MLIQYSCTLISWKCVTGGHGFCTLLNRGSPHCLPSLPTDLHAAYLCRLPMPPTYAAYLCRLPMPPTYAAYLCRLPMPPTYAAYLCRLPMPPTYAWWTNARTMYYPNLYASFKQFSRWLELKGVATHPQVLSK